MSPPAAYPRTMRTLHWIMVGLVFSQLGIGMAMSGDDDRIHEGLFGWHTTVGVLVLALAVVRLGNRLRSQVPGLPPTMPAWERVAAATVHHALYAAMLVVPVLGYVAAGASPGAGGVGFLGLELPAVVSDDEALAEAFGGWHETLVWIFAGLLIVHVAAVIKHAFFDRAEHDVLRRML